MLLLKEGCWRRVMVLTEAAGNKGTIRMCGGGDGLVVRLIQK